MAVTNVFNLESEDKSRFYNKKNHTFSSQYRLIRQLLPTPPYHPSFFKGKK